MADLLTSILDAVQILTLLALIVYVIKTWEMASATKEYAETSKETLQEIKTAREQEYRRKIEVNLWLDIIDGETIVHLCAFNPSYRSVTLIKCNFQVDDEPIEINRTSYEVDRTKYPNGPSRYVMRVTTEFNYPKHILKEGDAVFYSVKARLLAYFLHYHGFNGRIKLNGYFKTAQKNKVESKSIEFNIEEYYRE
jgi:hypothetical protein